MTRSYNDTNPVSTADPTDHAIEWSVYYIRTTWQSGQRRIFQSRPPAERFIRKLRGMGRPDLAPLEYAVLQSRPVGLWRSER